MTVDGSLVVVTQFLEAFETFEGWLRSRADTPDEPAATPPPPAPAPPSGGEFTQLFRPIGDSAATPKGETAPPAPPIRAAAAAPPPRPPAQPPPPPPPSGGPNFTEMFRGPAGPAPASKRSDSEPGPLPIISLRLPSRPVFSGAEPPPAPPKLTPNLEAAAPPPEPLDLPRLGNYLLDAPEPASPVQPASPAWGAGAASEFTRQLSRSPQMSPVTPEVIGGPEPPPAMAQPARSYVPLLLALNLVVIIALGLILYFALRR
jgi:Wiskott-Aldrich syndrome protein